MTGKKIAWLLPLMALLMGCGGQPTAKKLVEIDSLLWSEETDSAYQMIADYDPASFKNEADHAYYNLLMTHAACVSLHFPSSDSLINEAIRYYKHTGEKERLVDSYYYKASIFMNQQDWNKSIEILKLAEEKVEQTESNYTDKLIPYLYDLKKSCGANFNPEFLSSIGYNYMSVGRYEEAKKYLEQSLMVRETAVAYSYLAWIYQKEGDEEQAHLLYLKAQAINDGWPKHKVLYNLLQYDIAHQNLEDAEKKLESIMAISDSLRQAENDRRVLEYQRKFDQLVAHENHKQQLLIAGIAIIGLLFVIVLLIMYIRYRKTMEKLTLIEQQMIISNYANEIAQVKRQQTDTDAATEQIEELNNKIRELVEKESPRLVKGKLLYDDIKREGTTSGWSNDDYKCFIDYYKAIDFAAYCRIQKKYQPKTAHNTFFLILYEMGMDDKAVRRTMGITQEAIRSTRFRIQQGMKK